MRPVEWSKYISGRMPQWRYQCINENIYGHNVVGYELRVVGDDSLRDTAGIPFGAVSELGAGERLAGGGDAMAVMRWRQLATD